MSESALFIAWGPPATGREHKVVEMFEESMHYLSELVGRNEIASAEFFFLEPHGGSPDGFFLVRGDRDNLYRVRTSDEFQRLVTKAQIVFTNLAVIGAITGRRLNKHLMWHAEAAREVEKG